MTAPECIYQHPTWLAFVRRIRETPDDDLPRRVAGDWLRDQGEWERAEFIDVQCEIARLDDWCLSWQQKKHAALLFGRNADMWVPELPGRPLWCKRQHDFAVHFSERQDGDGERLILTFTRGFGESVVSPSAAWLTHGDRILEQHPIRTVRLTDRPVFESRPSHWGFEGEARFPGRTMRHRGQPVTGIVDAYRLPTAEEMLAAEWPGVTFELPPEPAEFWIGLQSGSSGWLYVNGQQGGEIGEWQIGIANAVHTTRSALVAMGEAITRAGESVRAFTRQVALAEATSLQRTPANAISRFARKLKRNKPLRDTSQIRPSLRPPA